MANEPTPLDPLELRAIDRQAPEGRDADFVAAVMARVEALPAFAPMPIDPLWGIWSMSRGLSAAALAIAVLLAALHAWELRHVNAEPATVAEALGVPPTVAQMMGSGGGR